MKATYNADGVRRKPKGQKKEAEQETEKAVTIMKELKRRMTISFKRMVTPNLNALASQNSRKF